MPQQWLKNTLLGLLGLMLIIAIVFAPVIWGGKTLLPADQLNTMMLPYSAKHDSVRVYNHFLTDAIAQVYPYKVRWRENALRGEFFSWNPSILGGHPHYASTSFTHFDPTNVVLLLGEMPAAYHAQMLVKLLIAGVGMWILLGAFCVGDSRMHHAIRLTFSAAYMLNSLFVTTLQHQWLLGAMCWTPWALYFVLRCYSQQSNDAKPLKKNIAFAALFLAFACLAGSLQTSAIAILAVVVIAVSLAFFQAKNNEPATQNKFSTTIFLRGIGVLIAVGALGFLLSAVMWLPSLELFLYNENIRAAGKGFSPVNSLKSLPLLVSFVIPELIGTPRGFDLAKIAQADMNDFNASIGFAPWFFGILGCVLLWKNAVVSLTHSDRKQPAHIKAFILLAALGLALPLATPLYKFIYHRSFVLYVLGMTVVGACAAEYLLFTFRQFEGDSVEKIRKRVRAVILITAWLLGIVIVGLVVGNIVLAWKYDFINAKLRAFVESNMQLAQLAGGSKSWMLGRVDVLLHHFSWKNPWLWFAVIAPSFSLVLISRRILGTQEPEKNSRQVAWILCFITVLQLWIGVHSWLPMIDTSVYPLYPPTQTTDVLKRDSSLNRFLPLFDAASHRVMQPNINDMYGIACIQGYESIFPRNASMLAGTLSQPVLRQHIQMGALANVKYYVASAKNPCSHPALRLVDSGATLVYENLLAEERAYMRYRYKIVQPKPGEETVSAIKKKLGVPPIEPFVRVLTEDSLFAAKEVLFAEEPHEQILRGEDAIPHTIRFVNYENNRVCIEVETAERGYLVLADTYYTGWRAFVNGQETPIMRANLALRAVVVPKGKSTVEYRFEPPLAKIGAWISFGACIMCFGLIILQRQKKI